MDLTISGKVIEVLDEQSGESRNGPWRKREFILETAGEYPKQVCVIQWGEKIDEWAVEVGEELTAHIDIQSREYKGRWYTDVKAWKVERDREAPAVEPGPFEHPTPGGPADLGPDDDLPF